VVAGFDKGGLCGFVQAAVASHQGRKDPEFDQKVDALCRERDLGQLHDAQARGDRETVAQLRDAYPGDPDFGEHDHEAER
jgi:hypothetical protein